MRRKAAALALLLLVLFLGGVCVWQWREAQPASDSDVIQKWAGTPIEPGAWRPILELELELEWPEDLRIGHWEFTVDIDIRPSGGPYVLERRPVTVFARLREWLGAL